MIYGLLCVVLLVLRRRKPLWYAPTFRMKGVPAIPVVGAITSFGLIPLMQPLSIRCGTLVVLHHRAA